MRPRTRPWSPVVFVAVVSTLPAPSPCARAQAVKAEPAPSPAGGFPAKVVEAMRREAEARSKEQEALFTRARAAPPVVPNAPVGQVPVVIERVVVVPAAPAPLPRREPVMMKQAVAVPAGVVNPGLNQQWLTRMRPILRVEYQFLRTVCDPTREQRMPIARAGLAALDDAVKKYLEWQNVRNRGVMVVNGKIVNRAGAADLPDPRKAIQEALGVAARANLPAESWERYRKEVEARSEELKQVAITGMVAKLDHILLLSAEQRDAILQALSSRWNTSWSSVLQYSGLDQHYFPFIPDEYIVPSLNDDQKKLWEKSGKVMPSPATGVGPAQFDDGPLDDEFPDEAVTGPGAPK
jgi:hypothetical protein